MKRFKNAVKYSLYILLCIVFYACEYMTEGMIVKDANGNIYRLEEGGKINEHYKVIAIDTIDYRKRFK